MSNLQPQFQKDFLSGMVTNISKNIAPQNSVALGMNVDFDEELGAVTSRLGTGIVGTQLVNNNTVLGLHDFRDSDGSNHALIAAINASGGATSVVYKVGTGTIVTGLTASKKMRFLTYLDSALMVNGTDAPRSYDGASVITTGGAFDLANIPFAEPSLCIEWLDRVYLAGDTANPDRVYYSSLPSAGAVSWTSGNGTVDIEPEDGGGGITAFAKVPGYILIFKERSLKRWNFDSAFPESLVQIGTPTQECVVMGGGMCAFFSASNRDARGFYVTNGGRPVLISHDRARGIKKWVDAIPQASEALIAGYATDRVFAWSVGDLTVDGVSYTNVVLRYNRILDQWSVRSYPSQFSVFSSYVSSGVNTTVGGDDDGTILEIDKAGTYTDYDSGAGAVTPIFYEVALHPEDFGYNQKKELSDKIVVKTRNADGARIEIYADGKKTNFTKTVESPVTTVGLPTRILTIPMGTVLKGNEFAISIKGEVRGARATLLEVEYPNITVLPTVY